MTTTEARPETAPKSTRRLSRRMRLAATIGTALLIVAGSVGLFIKHSSAAPTKQNCGHDQIRADDQGPHSLADLLAEYQPHADVASVAKAMRVSTTYRVVVGESGYCVTVGTTLASTVNSARRPGN